MPHEIKVGEVYETKCGDRARIICTDRVQPDYPVLALVMIGEIERVFSYTKEGKFHDSPDGAHELDLVLPQGPYDDWEIDDPIWAWDFNPRNARRVHFARANEAGVLAFHEGRTQWSSDGVTQEWLHASKTDPRNSK